ncbi:MAG TPA: hypothetical protein VGK74_18790 [Symbiobacteriaceae bacterium]|jgi:hypothetical protein
MKRVRVWAAALLAVALVAGLVRLWPRRVEMQADYPHYASARQIARRADIVVVGRVEGVAVRAVSVGDKTLAVTEASVRILEPFKGEGLPAVITVKQMGGRLGTVTYEEIDTVPYQPGQRLLLLLARVGDGQYMALNPEQGSLPVSAHDTVSYDGTTYRLADIKALMNPGTR